jgi:DNA-binding MurR/RpiR family transcriptional regulator
MVLSQEEIRKGDSMEEIIRKITWQNIQSLQETQRLMDPQVLRKCAEQMQKAQRILLFGLGASLVTARDAYLKLLRINKTCVISEDWHLQLVYARCSTPKDLAIIISYSGYTSEMITCAKALKDNKTPILAITRPVKSPLSDLADLKLYTTSSESLFRSAAIASRISSLDIIDILYTAYANMDYDYSLRQLRKTHIDRK